MLGEIFRLSATLQQIQRHRPDDPHKNPHI